MTYSAFDASLAAMSVTDLWRSTEAGIWKRAVGRYWQWVEKGQNVELERALDALNIDRLRNLSAQGWYNFLHDEYFRWKYTAANRYATTTNQLRKYLDGTQIDELDNLRKQLLNLDCRDIRQGLTTAKKIRGLGTAGASGLLSLMYPEHFATVDQFVVKALRSVSDLPETGRIAKMKPENLSVSDGELLIGIISRKATEINQLFGTSEWTPRKIDMVLWTYGRPSDAMPPRTPIRRICVKNCVYR